MLKELLQYLEEKLDLEHIENTKKCLKSVIEYEEADWMPLCVGYPGDCCFKPRPYPEEYTDMGIMMYNELLLSLKGIEIKDATIPMLRANYGVGILPSVFGLNCRLLENNLPWVDRLGGTDDIKKLIDRGMPDLNTGLGGRTLETYEYYSCMLDKYPMCRKGFPSYHPDMQGPFDVAHLIWGPDIYYALYDDPEVVHELMKLVTETYIAYMKKLKQTIADEDGDYNYHWRTLFKGSVVVRNDSAVNLSKEMYEEFVRPYDEMILKEFGEGSIHYCGRADHWVFAMMETQGLGALNFGQPPNLTFGFDFLGKIYGRAKERKIAIINYDVSKEHPRAIISSGYKTGVTFSTSAGSREEALEMIQMCRG